MKRIPMPEWANESLVDRKAKYLIFNKKTKGGNLIKQPRVKGKPKPPPQYTAINGEPVSTNYIYDKILKWRDATKFKHVEMSPHTLRRYFVTNLLKQGASDSNISRLGGWSNSAQVFKYGYDVHLSNNPAVKLVKY
jgi:integrase